MANRKVLGVILRTLLLLAVAGGIVLLYFRRSAEEPLPEQRQASPVKVMRPLFGTLENRFITSGYVETRSTVTLLPKIAGTLEELAVDMGDPVQKGDVVAVIDDRQHSLTLKQAQAAYTAAKATFERTERMFQSNAASNQDYDQARAHYDATKSQYELALLNMEYTRIQVPISGVVLQKHVCAGALVAPQIPIITVGDLSELTVKGKVPEDYYAFFLKEQAVVTPEVSVPALDNLKLSSRVKTVAPYISPESRNFEVVCTLPKDLTAPVRPGMWVNIAFPLERREEIHYLPHQALVAGKTLWYVDPETGNGGRMEFRPQFQNQDYFQIDSKYGDYQFILEGQHFLQEGAAVRILDSEEPP